MKSKCEAWIKEGMGACRAPVTTIPAGSKAHTQTIGHPMTLIERSRLRALSTEQVLNIASTQIAAGNIGRWPRIRRLWTDKNMYRTDCETELAWAMGYTAIKEDK